MGGYSSQKNLRLALSYFDMPMPGQPEVFVGQCPSLVDNSGTITPEATVEFLRDDSLQFVNQYMRI